MEIVKVLERVKGIPGLMDPAELELLCRMARSAAVIVELGCYKGRSLAAMQLASCGAEVYGVDSFGDMSHRGYAGSTEDQVWANMAKVGASPKRILAFPTDQAAEMWPEDLAIDLLHVDAGHSYEEVRGDIKRWLPKLAPGGAVVYHDYGKARKEVLDRPEVKRAVDNWQKTKRGQDWVEEERAGVSIAFRQIIADAGALVIAYGPKARDAAKALIASLRKHKPTLPIAAIGEQSL